MITESPMRALDPARPHDDAHLVQRKVGRVEEHHLADLGIQRVEPERANGARCWAAGTVSLSSTESEAAQEAHQLRELLVGQAGPSGVLVAMVLLIRWW